MNNIHARLYAKIFLCGLLTFPRATYARDYKSAPEYTENMGVRLLHNFTTEIPKDFSIICDLAELEANLLCYELITHNLYSDLKMMEDEEINNNCSNRLAIFPGVFGGDGHIKVTIPARRCPITSPIRLWISQGNENDNGTLFVFQQFSAAGPIQFDTCLSGFLGVNIYKKPVT